ncbi:MAG: ActS/PrrB/RegB family redox-sensitive histidine kinase, partial [Pseudomonadota bacterium]
MEDLADHQRLDVNEALFTLAPEGLGSAGSALGRTRLRTFIALRWMAVVGQSAAVLIVYFGLGFEVPLGLCLSAIAASAWLNVFLSLALPSNRLAQPWEAMAQLAFDLVQLSSIIAFTGGLSNPFLLFLIAPVMVGALILKPFQAASLAALGFALGSGMAFWSLPLPWYGDAVPVIPDLFRLGHLTALALGLAFLAITAMRVSQDEARLVRALDAASVVMAREQRLSAIGAMAAMTAHELGTPLATIHLVAREMAGTIDKDDPSYEDARLIAEQAERCRTILRQLGERREAEDIVHARMPLGAVLEEAAAPHRGLGIAVRIETQNADGTDEKPPTLFRSPEVLHALGAIIENAVSFADTEVRATANWNSDQIAVTISDDGPGFAAEVLQKLGEPYVSQRDEARLGGGDMGLGFFIAKTLIERTGGGGGGGAPPPPPPPP